MAAIIRDFNATIIKNTGDSLLYYFPKTSNNSADDRSVFKEVFECGLTMVEARFIIGFIINYFCSSMGSFFLSITDTCANYTMTEEEGGDQHGS
jgi:hypothetical protein